MRNYYFTDAEGLTWARVTRKTARRLPGMRPPMDPRDDWRPGPCMHPAAVTLNLIIDLVIVFCAAIFQMASPRRR